MDQQELNTAFYAAQAGDGDAFAKLFDAFWNMAYYNCVRHLRNQQDAEDAVQEVFLILHRRIGNLKGPEYLAKGIQYYTMEVCSGYYKNKKRIPSELLSSLDDMLETPPTEKEEFLPESVLENKELKEQILDLVNHLPPKQKSVLFHYYFNDFSAAEIAKLMGISVSAVGFNLHKARKKLSMLVKEKSDIGQPLLPALAPVLTKVFFENMQFNATPVAKQQIAQALLKRLATDPASTGRILESAGRTAAHSTGRILGLSHGAVTGAASVAACACLALGAFQIYQTTYPAAPESPPAVVSQESDFLTALKKVKYESDLDLFKREWDIRNASECVDETGALYSISAKIVDGKQYFIGYKSANNNFALTWEETLPGESLPEGTDIIVWMEKQQNLD
ncbi:MAG: sigma-70 family RNA polymerase sigma factor [Clostridiales bacterium]|nr:sigma-70 family RNA polymerase sigma factor [Clostridiales bacterium]